MTNWNECREIEQKLKKKKTKKRTSYRKKAWSVFVFVILLTAIFPFSFFAPSIGNDDNCVVLVFCCCLHSLCRLLIVCNGRYHISMHDDMILVSFSPFFSVQLNEENGIFFTIQKQSTTSIPFFFVCVCLNLVKCENCLRKMTAWDKLLTVCVCKKQKRKENLLFFFLFFLPSDSDVMLLTTNSRILFFFLFWECVGHIFFLYRCYCRIVTGCGIAWRLCRQWQQRMLLLGKRTRK